MPRRLPSIKGKELIKTLKKLGFVERRTTGSHVIMKNSETNKIIPIPMHGSKDIKRGTLFAIIKQTGISVEEFEKLLA